MIDLLPVALSLPTPVAPAAIGSVARVTAGFGQTLDAFLAAQDDAAAAAALPEESDRQALAGDGNPLPDTTAIAPADPAAPIPASPWTIAFTPLPVLDIPYKEPARATPPLATSAAATRGPRTFVDPGTAVAAATKPPAQPPVPPPVPGVDPAHAATAVPDAMSLLAQTPVPVNLAELTTRTPPVTAKLAPSGSQPIVDRSSPPRTPVEDIAVAPVALRAAATIVVDAVPRPARLVFAPAIAAVGGRMRTARAEPVETITIALAATPDTADRRVAAAPSAIAAAPVELGSDRGLRQIVDRIVALRDDAQDAVAARDTRIRLTPDALGTVEIAVHREGDAVRVHFTAEREATQALLIDAQPRLTDLAAARGLRIDEASVSTGSAAQQQHQHGATPQSRTPFLRAPAHAPTDNDPADTRLA